MGDLLIPLRSGCGVVVSRGRQAAGIAGPNADAGDGLIQRFASHSSPGMTIRCSLFSGQPFGHWVTPGIFVRTRQTVCWSISVM